MLNKKGKIIISGIGSHNDEFIKPLFESILQSKLPYNIIPFKEKEVSIIFKNKK